MILDFFFEISNNFFFWIFFNMLYFKLKKIRLKIFFVLFEFFLNMDYGVILDKGFFFNCK